MTSNKVFISFDMEGIGGVTYWSETLQREYAVLATRQLLAYCEGVHAMDSAAYILVADSHANARNIAWEMLPDYVHLIKGFPRNHYMMEGLDDSFSHLVLFGYHTAIGGGGMMDHTYSSSSFFEVRINGRPVDEGVINALYAADFGVPLNFVYGDDKTTAYYREHFPEVDTLTSKKAIARYAGQCFPEPYLLQRLHEMGAQLFHNPAKPLDWGNDITCQITLTDSIRTYLASVVPGVTQTAERMIEFHPASFVELYRYLMTIVYVTAVAKQID